MSVISDVFRELCKFVGRSNRKCFSQSMEIVKMCRELQNAELKGPGGPFSIELNEIIDSANSALKSMTSPPGSKKPRNPLGAFMRALDEYPNVTSILKDYKRRLIEAQERDSSKSKHAEGWERENKKKRKGQSVASQECSDQHMDLEVQIYRVPFRPLRTTSVRCLWTDTFDALLWLITQYRFLKGVEADDCIKPSVFRNPHFYSSPFPDDLDQWKRKLPIKPVSFSSTVRDEFRQSSTFHGIARIRMLYDGNFSCTFDFCSPPMTFGNMWNFNGDLFLMKDSDGILDLSTSFSEGLTPHCTVRVTRKTHREPLDTGFYRDKPWAEILKDVLELAKIERQGTVWTFSVVPPFPEPIGIPSSTIELNGDSQFIRNRMIEDPEIAGPSMVAAESAGYQLFIPETTLDTSSESLAHVPSSDGIRNVAIPEPQRITVPAEQPIPRSPADVVTLQTIQGPSASNVVLPKSSSVGTTNHSTDAKTVAATTNTTPDLSMPGSFVADAPKTHTKETGGWLRKAWKYITGSGKG